MLSKFMYSPLLGCIHHKLKGTEMCTDCARKSKISQVLKKWTTLTCHCMNIKNFKVFLENTEFLTW